MVLRWYVEGVTEYYAVRFVLPDLSEMGIELINLIGNISSSRADIALKLQQLLTQDKELRRFSMISFDTDVAENVKAIQNQVREGNVIGQIAAHKPDFEFANFTVRELAEIAARMDEQLGFSGNAVRFSDWSRVRKGADFERHYKSVSESSPRGLKGKAWGEALAKYALEFHNREDNGRERPFWEQIRAALYAKLANYDLQKSYTFNLETFEILER